MQLWCRSENVVSNIIIDLFNFDSIIQVAVLPWSSRRFNRKSSHTISIDVKIDCKSNKALKALPWHEVCLFLAGINAENRSHSLPQQMYIIQCMKVMVTGKGAKEQERKMQIKFEREREKKHTKHNSFSRLSI